ncbi:PREDICTED: protein STAY-GREEN 1, chloroplastic-like [Camelina sativa]|uniref:Protein STAY-GREEN 1, chloroplastic-like n=1 Tax=Camelina sativa TaxID=90675 RepID=A0ABM0VG13_CAMSA|nr:PREDICTED: protein STAY-GREEN 1, chloroplastic-like [Camelina sativa]
MCSLMANLLLPANLKQDFSDKERGSSIPSTTRSTKKKKQSMFPVARLFGQAVFEASKLNVVFLGVDEKKHPSKLPRTYTLTHSDISSNLTLAISQSINNSQLQGWTNKLYRDEVVAEWRKVKSKMSLHVHCHISGDHFLLDLTAKLRYFIFCKELPMVLNAFVYGDENMLNNYPELHEACVWVYFHSNIPEFNKVECLGPLCEATSRGDCKTETCEVLPEPPCLDECSCCFPMDSTISWSSHSHGSQGHEEDEDVATAGENLVTEYTYNRSKRE